MKCYRPMFFRAPADVSPSRPDGLSRPHASLPPAKARGALASLNQVFIVSGILIAFLTDYALASSHNWRGMFLGALVPAVILLGGLTILPETPRWLIKEGRETEARAVLAATHRGGDIEAEDASIPEVIRSDAQLKGRIRDLAAPWVRPMVI